MLFTPNGSYRIRQKRSTISCRPYLVPEAHKRVFEEELDRWVDFRVLSTTGPATYLWTTHHPKTKRSSVSDFAIPRSHARSTCRESKYSQKTQRNHEQTMTKKCIIPKESTPKSKWGRDPSQNKFKILSKGSTLRLRCQVRHDTGMGSNVKTANKRSSCNKGYKYPNLAGSNPVNVTKGSHRRLLSRSQCLHRRHWYLLQLLERTTARA